MRTLIAITIIIAILMFLFTAWMRAGWEHYMREFARWKRLEDLKYGHKINEVIQRSK